MGGLPFHPSLVRMIPLYLETFTDSESQFGYRANVAKFYVKLPNRVKCAKMEL